MQVLLLYCLIRLISVIFGLQLSDEDMMTTYTNTISFVYHMETDEYIQGNLLFANLHSLRTTDGSTTQTIAGHAGSWGYTEGTGTSARFNHIKSFIQLTESQVIVVDFGNCCIRSVERHSNVTSSYVGECRVCGNIDGTAARFSYPHSMIKDLKNPGHYFIAEAVGKSLRYMSESDKNVTTLYRGTLQYHHMLQQKTTGDIFITYKHGIEIYNYRDNTMSNLVGSSFLGFEDGMFDQVKFFNPFDIQLLNEDTLLVADGGNHRLRVLNLSTNTSRSICSGTRGHVDGNLSSCQLSNPGSLLLWQNTLYVGEEGRIRTVKGATVSTYTPELSQHTSSSTSTTTETTTATEMTTATEVTTPTETATSNGTQRINWPISTNTPLPKSTEDVINRSTTRKSTEPSSISNLHIALISSAVGIMAIISVLIFVTYIVKMRTKANNRNKSSAAPVVRMQEVISHPSTAENQTGQEENTDEIYDEIDTDLYLYDHVYSVPAC